MKNNTTIISLLVVTLLCGCATPRFTTNQDGKTTLMTAVERRDVAKVNEMMSRANVDVNARCDAWILRVQNYNHGSSSDSVLLKGKGNSALSLAILNNSAEIVKVLLENGADTTIEVVYSDGGVQCRGGGNVLELTSSDFYNVKESRATIIELARHAKNPTIASLVTDPQIAQKAAAAEARKKAIEAQNQVLTEEVLQKLKARREAENAEAAIVK